MISGDGEDDDDDDDGDVASPYYAETKHDHPTQQTAPFGNENKTTPKVNKTTPHVSRAI